MYMASMAHMSDSPAMAPEATGTTKRSADFLFSLPQSQALTARAATPTEFENHTTQDKPKPIDEGTNRLYFLASKCSAAATTIPITAPMSMPSRAMGWM